MAEGDDAAAALFHGALGLILEDRPAAPSSEELANSSGNFRFFAAAAAAALAAAAAAYSLALACAEAGEGIPPLLP